jgi:predicted Zn-dependent protease
LIRGFRNHKGIRFHGAIHELVGESIHRLNLSSSITDIPIYHYGWITSNRTDEEKQRKKQEYHRLIKHEWEKDPSPKMAFYYLSTMESPEEKIKFGFKMVNEFPEVIQFHELIARSAVELKQWSRALSYVDKGLQRFPGHTPFLAIKAKCLNETGAPLDALNILDALLEKDLLHPLYWFEKFRSLILLKRKDEAEALKQHLPSHFSPDLIRELLNVI